MQGLGQDSGLGTGAEGGMSVGQTQGLCGSEVQDWREVDPSVCAVADCSLSPSHAPSPRQESRLTLTSPTRSCECVSVCECVFTSCGSHTAEPRTGQPQTEALTGLEVGSPRPRGPKGHGQGSRGWPLPPLQLEVAPGNPRLVAAAHQSPPPRLCLPLCVSSLHLQPTDNLRQSPHLGIPYLITPAKTF